MQRALVALAATAAATAAYGQRTIGFQSFEGNTVAAGLNVLGAIYNEQQILELDANGDGVINDLDGTGELIDVDGDGDGLVDGSNPVFEFRQPTQFFTPTGGFVSAPGGTGRTFDSTDGSLPWVTRWANARLTQASLDAAIAARELADEAVLFENTGINIDLVYVASPTFNPASRIGPVTGAQYDSDGSNNGPARGANGSILLDGAGNPLLANVIPNAILNQTPGPNFGVIFDLGSPVAGAPVINGVSAEGPIGTANDAFGVANAARLGGTFGPTPAFIPDGQNVFYVEDPDGAIFLDFEGIDLGSLQNPELRFDLVTAATGYEEFDVVAVSVNGIDVLGPLEGQFELGVTPDLITGEVDPLETASFAEGFDRQYIDLSPWTGQTIDIRFTFDYSANNEEGAVDNIQIVGFDAAAAPGDLNADGQLDGRDFDLLLDATRGLGLTNSQLDINGDGALDFVTDAAELAALAGTVIGDADGDGSVNTGDLSALADGFSRSLASGTDGPFLPKYSQGDFNGDGVVNSLDVSTLSGVFGFGANSSAAAVAVPEPSVAALGAIATLALLRRARG